MSNTNKEHNMDTKTIEQVERHARHEGERDYRGRAQDVDRGAAAPDWAWPFAGADEAYVNAVGTRKICRDAGIDEDAWNDVSDAWLAAFKRGYEAAHRGRAFVEALVKVCEEHGMSLSHEDQHGSFMFVDRLDGDYLNWLRGARLE